MGCKKLQYLQFEKKNENYTILEIAQAILVVQHSSK